MESIFTTDWWSKLYRLKYSYVKLQVIPGRQILSTERQYALNTMKKLHTDMQVKMLL